MLSKSRTDRMGSVKISVCKRVESMAHMGRYVKPVGEKEAHQYGENWQAGRPIDRR